MASIHVTDDAEVAATSVRPEWAEHSQAAWGHHFLDEAAAAFRRGELRRSRELLRSGTEALDAAAASLGVPELSEDARFLDEQRMLFEQHGPTTEEGKRAIKQGKERFRGRAR